MHSDTIGSAFDTSYLHLIGCLAALVMVSEAGAGGLVSLPTSYAVGDHPEQVAVADLDGDTVPDIVVANALDDDLSLLPTCFASLFSRLRPREET